MVVFVDVEGGNQKSPQPLSGFCGNSLCGFGRAAARDLACDKIYRGSAQTTSKPS